MVIQLTCIALRLPMGCVNVPEKIQPSGTHSKLIEPVKRITLFHTRNMPSYRLYSSTY